MADVNNKLEIERAGRWWQIREVTQDGTPLRVLDTYATFQLAEERLLRLEEERSKSNDA